MLDYEEELKKFKPSLEVDDIEEAVYQEDLSDMTDILRDAQSGEIAERLRWNCMEYTEKILHQSNYWYNDGLRKAKIRDISGAVQSLKRSLQYNRENIPARNLLGLVYYERGEIAEAIVEWILSQNFQKSDNLAGYFIREIQKDKKTLEEIDRAVQMYNQCLVYCDQGAEDLAVIQLKKAVQIHPSYLKAYQLLALLYLKTGQYQKAKQVLKRAHRLDTTNETTLKYMHELSELRETQGTKGREQKTYEIGNDTVIQPAVSPLKENAGFLTILNIVIGILLGAAVVWFLIVPAVNEVKSNRSNKSVLAFKEEINSKDAQISAMKKELETIRNSSDENEAATAAALAAKDSYEKLLTVKEHYNSGQYAYATLAKELLEVQKDSLGDQGKVQYQAIADEVYPSICAEHYSSAKQSYQQGDYPKAITLLEELIRMDGHYKDGEALLLLGDSYLLNNEKDKAEAIYKQIIEAYPKTDVAKRAEEAQKGTPANTQGAGTEESVDSGQSGADVYNDYGSAYGDTAGSDTEDYQGQGDQNVYDNYQETEESYGDVTYEEYQ